jgi:hypothetical protein
VQHLQTRVGHEESHCFPTNRLKVKVTTLSGKVCNYCNKTGNFANECWKKTNCNFSGNISRGITDGKVTIVKGAKREAFAKTNHHCGKRAIG